MTENHGFTVVQYNSSTAARPSNKDDLYLSRPNVNKGMNKLQGSFTQGTSAAACPYPPPLNQVRAVTAIRNLAFSLRPTAPEIDATLMTVLRYHVRTRRVRTRKFSSLKSRLTREFEAAAHRVFYIFRGMRRFKVTPLS
jgi:hypothetical protein